MGWNYETADWSIVTGVLFPGGAGAPAFWTAVAIIACIAALWFGNRAEHAKYKDHN